MDNQHVSLVTGGAGFIGSHFCKSLLEAGLSVVCVDSLVTGRRVNIEPLLTEQGFSFIQGDVRDENILGQLSPLPIVEIYNLASPASVDFITDNPIYAATTNSVGVNNLLELAVEKKAKFLFASSSEVYGDPKDHPQKETYWGNVNPVGVRSGYDEGKRFGEALVMAYHRKIGLETRIARIFNTYGPNSSPSDGRVIPRFITQAIAGQPIPVHGDGTQTRSFCYVTDMVLGLIALMESDIATPVNFGNPVEVKIVDVAKKIIALTKSSSQIQFTDRPSDDPFRRKPDITLAKQALGWEPIVSFDEGLQKTIDYLKHV